jgi:tRNA1Val (adenine37-N6)-methyltransferase
VNAISSDTLGSLRIRQPQNGYRFSIDPLLLAHQLAPRSGERILDLGTGCGIIALLLALKNPEARILAVEIQPDLASLARQNVSLNGMDCSIQVLETDMRLLDQARIRGPVDSIAINPPYYKLKSGRMNPQDEKAVARHEIHLTLKEWILTAKRLLKTGGRLHVVFPADRSAELLHAMSQNNITPKRLRSVHSLPHTPARLVLVEGILAAGSGIHLPPPLFLYKAPGLYTPEVLDILSPGGPLPTEGPDVQGA